MKKFFHLFLFAAMTSAVGWMLTILAPAVSASTEEQVVPLPANISAPPIPDDVREADRMALETPRVSEPIPEASELTPEQPPAPELRNRAKYSGTRDFKDYKDFKGVLEPVAEGPGSSPGGSSSSGFGGGAAPAVLGPDVPASEDATQP